VAAGRLARCQWDIAGKMDLTILSCWISLGIKSSAVTVLSAKDHSVWLEALERCDSGRGDGGVLKRVAQWWELGPPEARASDSTSAAVLRPEDAAS
jgi:hypothetical protein